MVENLKGKFDVELTMLDKNTGEQVIRTIDKSNAFSSGSVCWELKGKEDQRKNLESWIKERGNEQHNTTLELISWRFV